MSVENKETDGVLVRAENICYSYPHSERKALDGVNFTVNSGDYIALVGCNGSGKSTLSRMIAGFFEPDSGSLERKEGLLPGIVFQQPKEQIVAGVVERDTAFGPQNLDMSKAEIELRTMECLAVTGLADRASSRTFELSLGQTQRLAFSGILALFPDLLILDEVTAMLDPKARNEIISFTGQWNAKGHTIIHVTHDQEEALRAKRVIALKDGKIIFDGTRDDFIKNTDVFSQVFKDDTELFESFAQKAELEERPVTLSVQGLEFSYPDRNVFSNLSLKLRKGTLTALTGPSGCGKSTLLECIAGLKSYTKGKILCKEHPALSLQESDAALFAPYAADDVAFGAIYRDKEGRELLECVKRSMNAVGLDYTAFGNRRTFALSGGEKRKLSIAGILALDTEVLLFDEPTAALDSESRITVMKCLKELAKNGKTVLFTTHRMEEADMADVSLRWEFLQSDEDNENGETPQTAGSLQTSGAPQTALPEQNPMKNSALIERLQKSAQAFMAPPKIPYSPVSRLPAAVKYLLFMLLFVASIAMVPTYGCVSMLFLSIIYALCAKYPLKMPLKACVKIFPWLLLFALIQFFFYTNTAPSPVLFTIGKTAITQAKLMVLIKTFIRAPAIIITIGTFVFSTDERQILDGLSDLLKPLALIKVPVRYLVLVTGLTFRFIPLLLDELCGILKTQMIRGTFDKARGFAKLKILIPLFVPLMLQAFRKAQYLADALTARYFK